MPDMQMEDMVIASVDDHIVEPPDMFQGHLPADVVQPHIVEEDGKQAWIWDDIVTTNIGLNAVVGNISRLLLRKGCPQYSILGARLIF